MVTSLGHSVLVSRVLPACRLRYLSRVVTPGLDSRLSLSAAQKIRCRINLGAVEAFISSTGPNRHHVVGESLPSLVSRSLPIISVALVAKGSGHRHDLVIIQGRMSHILDLDLSYLDHDRLGHSLECDTNWGRAVSS